MDNKERKLKFSKKVKYSHIANGSSCGQSSTINSWCITNPTYKTPITLSGDILNAEKDTNKE